MHKLVLLRHGESQWNLENRFTGWHDVNLTEQGEREGREAGRLLKAEGFEFDVAYTSVLTRAIRTLWLALTEMDQVWIPVHREWRLNERHYGALQGLNKAETAEKHGDEQVLVWRRSYDIPPPPMSKDDDGYAGKDRRYANLDEANIPLTECPQGYRCPVPSTLGRYHCSSDKGWKECTHCSTRKFPSGTDQIFGRSIGGGYYRNECSHRYAFGL